MILDIQTPRWAVPLLRNARYKGVKGGRGSGKSHFFAELAVEVITADPAAKIVCIREIQKSLKYSAKSLIESKIRALGVSRLFDITLNEIRRKDASGIILFQGMQDHTADSIKSLEGFNYAWVEEAQNLSDRSLKLLRPTIRAEGSEIWFSWNTDQPDDAVDAFFKSGDERFICVHANIHDNPWASDDLLQEMEFDRINNPDDFDWVWLGQYNTRSEAQVFRNKYVIEPFDTENLGNPYYGLDFGFSQDPTAAVRCFIADNRLWIDYEAGGIGVDLDKTYDLLSKMPGIESYVIRADNARPESISYLKRHGLPRIEAVKKPKGNKGSVVDGVEFIKSFDKVIIHPRCEQVAKEFRLYSYKIDKRSGDILPTIEDKNNHYIDALRYALEPMMMQKQQAKQIKFKI